MNKDFGRLSSRTAQLRDEILAIRPEVCVERAILTTKAYQEHEQDQVVQTNFAQSLSLLEGPHLTG